MNKVSSRNGCDRYSLCFFYLFFNADFKRIKPRLTFNYGEFAIIKIWVVNSFPNT